MNERRRIQNREAQTRYRERCSTAIEEATRWREAFDKEKPFLVGFTTDEEDNLIPCAFAVGERALSVRAVNTAMKAMDKPLKAIFYCMPLSTAELTEEEVVLVPRVKVY